MIFYENAKGVIYMSNVMGDGYLLELMFGVTSPYKMLSSFQLSQLSDNSVQTQLRAAGIDTNCAQYKAVIAGMKSSAAQNGAMYTNVQAIKNLMKQYDKDGNYIDPSTGLTGLLLTEETRTSKNRIISIPESSKEEMFQLVKKEFLRENGVLNGDTTNRADVYFSLYQKMSKDNRLASGHTLEQYERQYRLAFISMVKETNPKWEIGQPIPSGVLENISRESIEANMRKSIDIHV